MAVYVSYPYNPPQIFEGDILIGTVDGINKVFTTSEKFTMEFGGKQIKVYVNGVRQKLFDDYEVSESIVGMGFDTITFMIPPKFNDNLLSDYEVLEV